MWAAFRTGSAWRGWAGRCGHRLTAHYISRVSRRQAASTPDFATTKPAHSALIGRYYCAPRLITTSKVPRLRLVCLSIDGVTEAHQVCLVKSGIGAPSRTDTRCFSTMPDTMLDESFRNAYGSARAHSMLQSSCAPLPLPASPVLSLRSGIVGGVSLPEVLHYARRTQCFLPPNEHSPTSPNHEIEP